MNSRKKIDVTNKVPRVLVAPLDWGLGHATRCIPIIRALQQEGAEVLVAAEGSISKLLDNEFPGIRILPLPGYRIRYARNRLFFNWKLLWQMPRIGGIIKKEKSLLHDWVRSEGIDAVISDNRPGMFHASIPCVYITHQLHIETGNKAMSRYFSSLHRNLINSFDECWVPDLEEGKGLAGKLSHPELLPAIPVKYIGPLSRLKKTESTGTYDLLIMLSGPEPQRTIFENKLLKQAASLPLRIAVLRGLPGDTTLPSHPSHINIFNHLPAEELNRMIGASSVVVARGGYSTIMDLAAMEKPAILVPTPGQAEQEYLSSHLGKEGIFITVAQSELDLKRDLAKTDACKTFPVHFHSEPHSFIRKWMERTGLIRE